MTRHFVADEGPESMVAFELENSMTTVRVVRGPIYGLV